MRRLPVASMATWESGATFCTMSSKLGGMASANS